MTKLIKGVNDLATVNPELSKQWHPTKNGNLTPTDITFGSHKIVWWLLPYDDPITGKHFDFEWQAEIKSRVSGNGCPFLSRREIWPGYNDLATTNPKLATEWHPTKNGNLTPKDITANSHKKVWWLLSYFDYKTQKYYNFEWEAIISDRNRGDECPYLTGHSVWPGYNDLASANPELAAEWHPTKNDSLKPEDVTVTSHIKVWWLLPYDDPRTGKHFDFEWQAKIDDRTRGNGCPYLNGTLVWPGFNDLATVNPELAKEWHPEKNDTLTPADVTAGSNKKVWWLITAIDPVTNKEITYEWESKIADRNKGVGCPYIAVPKTIAFVKFLLKEKNIDFTSEKIFNNLKDQRVLPFDIFVNNSYIIEVDGKQHFKAVNFYGGKKDFNLRIKHDNIKNQYCADNNIPLLRIPYIYDSVVDKEKIEKFVFDFIATGEIPQEIIDFYSQYKFSNYVACIKSKNSTEAA